MRIRHKSKQHKSLADETGIDSLVVFFEENGTGEDEFVARFYAAWYLYDCGLHKQAYEAFRYLYNTSPETNTELTQDVMRSVYTMLQTICLKDGDVDNAEKWWQKSEASGVYATHFKYILYENKAFVLYEKKVEDSCVYYLNRSFDELIKDESWDENKSWCLNEQAAFFAMCGKTYEFERRNELLKLHPYEGEDGSTNLNIGLLFLQQAKRDSAIYYFKKAISGTDEVALAAYAQLAIDANNRGEHDSIFEYYQHSMERWNNMFQQKSESYTKRLESIYHNQELSEQLAQKKITTLILILCLLASLLLIVACGSGIVLLQRKRKYDRIRLERAKLSNARLEQNLQRVIEDLQNSKRALTNQEMQEKLKKLNMLTLELKQYAQDKSIAPHQLCEDFMALYTEISLDAVTRLKNAYNEIKTKDLLLCALVVQGFSISEIAYITDHDRQEIRQYFLRISKGLVGEAIGRIADFKAMLDERFLGKDVE